MCRKRCAGGAAMSPGTRAQQEISKPNPNHRYSLAFGRGFGYPRILQVCKPLPSHRWTEKSHFREASGIHKSYKSVNLCLLTFAVSWELDVPRTHGETRGTSYSHYPGYSGGVSGHEWFVVSDAGHRLISRSGWRSVTIATRAIK